MSPQDKVSRPYLPTVPGTLGVVSVHLRHYATINNVLVHATADGTDKEDDSSSMQYRPRSSTL